MMDIATNRPSTILDANRVIAANLSEIADLLEQQGADGFRIMAYRHAAETVIALDRPLANILAETGIDGLIALPSIGKSISAAISEMIRTGHWAQLERLRGTTAAEKLFCTVPGIGPQLAARIHDQLHLENLEALEAAAHDGRLRKVSGLGDRRIAIIRATLQERLGRRRIGHRRISKVPSVEQILDVDREYQQSAATNQLRKIAPKRFNPNNEAWLAVLHTRREDWIFTAIYSNTQRAHDLNKTQDWVIIYYHTDETAEGQCTVVTETVGPWAGYRVVRGREAACADYYIQRDLPPEEQYAISR